MKKKYYVSFSISALFVLCLFAGCSDKDDAPTMTASTNSVTILATGEEQSVEIATNQTDWDATCPASDSWCMLKKDGNKLKISATINEAVTTRSTLITIVSGTAQPQEIKVIQSAATPYLTFTGNTPIQLDGAGTNVALTINTNNATWSAERPDKDAWCTLSQDDNQLTISAEAYTVDAERQTTVTVTSGTGATAITKTFDVIQQGSAPIYAIAIPTDFSAGYVQKVMYKNTKIAEVCREYIRILSTTINKQMTVVYPVIDGNTDLTKGLTEDGGSLVWNKTANTVTYTAGSGTTLTKIYLEGGNLLTNTTTITPLATTVEAELLVDTRPNSTKFTYKMVKIGTQYWMAENLKAQSYLNGTEIPLLTNSTDWNNNTTGAYRKPFSDNESYLMYGAYYNGYTMYNEAELAPEGWIVPSNNEWTKLRNYIGTPYGSKLKSSIASDWNSGTSTNITGFNAIASGYYSTPTDDIGNGSDTFFWSTTKAKDILTRKESPYYYRLSSASTGMPTDLHSFEFGHTIRCVRK